MDTAVLKSCTRQNRPLILRSLNCGCVSCGSIFPASEVSVFSDVGQTGVCPECAEPAVLPDAAGYELRMETLLGMGDVDAGQDLAQGLVAA